MRGGGISGRRNLGWGLAIIGSTLLVDRKQRYGLGGHSSSRKTGPRRGILVYITGAMDNIEVANHRSEFSLKMF